MRKPRVLVFNHFAVPRGEPGGTRHVELFARILHWEHIIVASDFNPQSQNRISPSSGFLTVPVTKYSTNGPARVMNWVSYALRATARGMILGPVEVVYGSSPHLLAGLAAWLVARVKKANFILEVRDLWPQILVDMGQLSERSAIYRVLTWLERFLYARADMIVVMAPGTSVSLTRRGVPSERIRYIPNGADAEDFIPNTPRDVLRQRYGFHRLTAVYTGAHGPANGLDLLLEAAKAVPEMDIVLVGGGVEKARLQDLVRRESITNVRFHEPIPKNDIPNLLAAADIGLHVLADVQLFRSAVSPNKIFDYMAAALPILTNSPGAVADMVTESNGGIAVPPNGIAEGLKRFMRMPSTVRQEHGQAGRRWLEANNSRNGMATRLSQLLDDVSGRTD